MTEERLIQIEKDQVWNMLTEFWMKNDGMIPTENHPMFEECSLDVLEEQFTRFRKEHEITEKVVQINPHRVAEAVLQYKVETLSSKPAKVLVNTLNMERSDWLKWRRIGIGGSDAGAILGLANPKYSSPFKVYQDKIGQLPPDDSESQAAKAGNLLEPVVAQWFKDEMEAEGKDVKIRKRNQLLQSADHPFMLANVDREILCPKRGLGLLECKTADKYFMKEWEEDKIPDAYYVQVQHYLAVEPRYKYAYIAVLVGGNTFIYKEVERDEALIANLIKLEADFWQMVQDRTPPAIDGSESTKETLHVLYGDSVKDPVELPVDVETLVVELTTTKAHISDLETKKTELENKIKALLGENEIGNVNGITRITWKNAVSNKIDTKLLKEKFPDIAREVMKTSSSRRFLIKEVKQVKEVS